jgi:hypothetical protein
MITHLRRLSLHSQRFTVATCGSGRANPPSERKKRMMRMHTYTNAHESAVRDDEQKARQRNAYRLFSFRVLLPLFWRRSSRSQHCRQSFPMLLFCFVFLFSPLVVEAFSGVFFFVVAVAIFCLVSSFLFRRA